MSDNWLQFIPTDPEWRPTPAAADAAAELLRSFVPDAEEVEPEFKDGIEFFHPGGNWDGVRCPRCNADLEDWWPDAMEAVAATDFTNLDANVPCCEARVSLNDLNYGSPAAFGLFELQAMNPNVPDLSPEQIEALVERLGHPVRRIWLHI